MTRKEAKQKGLKHYHGKACKACGKTLKYTSNWTCVYCERNRVNSRDPEIYKKYIQSQKGQSWLKNYRKESVYTDIQNRYKKSDYEKNKEKYFGYGLKKYNMSIDEYNQMHEEQQGCCYVCGQKESKKRLAVDHNHETGDNRKLLCTKCNTALGLLNEDVNIMKKLIDYVESH